MNPLLTLSILVILAQIINILNDFQESFNFDATIQSFAQPLCAKELPQPGVWVRPLDPDGAILSPDVDTCIRVGIESTVAIDAIAIDTTKNSLFSGGAGCQI